MHVAMNKSQPASVLAILCMPVAKMRAQSGNAAWKSAMAL